MKNAIKKLAASFITTIIVSVITVQAALAAEDLLPVIPTKGKSGLLISQLPNQDIPHTIAEIIKICLNISGALTFCAFSVGGIMIATANGKEENITKGKNIMIWSTVGLVVIALSVAIVTGVTSFDFLGQNSGTLK